MEVIVHVVRRGKTETFRRILSDNPTKKQIADLVDYFEGQVGTVLDVISASGSLFRSKSNVTRIH